MSWFRTAERARLVAGGLLAAVLISGCDESEIGSDVPVSFVGDPSFDDTAGMYTEAGAQVVFGATVVINRGAMDATLTDASLVGDVPTSDAEVVELLVIDRARDQGDLVGAAPWPFEDYKQRAQALEGFALKPGAEAELLFVVEVRRTGKWEWSDTTVEYEFDGENSSSSTRFGFVICPTGTEC